MVKVKKKNEAKKIVSKGKPVKKVSKPIKKVVPIKFKPIKPIPKPATKPKAKPVLKKEDAKPVIAPKLAVKPDQSIQKPVPKPQPKVEPKPTPAVQKIIKPEPKVEVNPLVKSAPKSESKKEDVKDTFVFEEPKVVDKNRTFKYVQTDFGDLPARTVHFDLDFDIYNEETKVKSVMKCVALKDLTSISLDAKNLDFKSVTCDTRRIKWKFEKDAFKLLIAFHVPIKAGESFSITSEHSFKPTKNILEGMYFDETPKDAPPTMITQCQQWGFQRLVPCFDDMTAKCTYITSITADSRYTNLITNGDVTEERKEIEKGRDKIVYTNTKTPMAPYLFFLGVGTYDTHTKEVEYPEGDKFMIEFLVMKGSDSDAAKKAVQALHDCILWVYLFTGQHMYRNNFIARKIWQLTEELQHAKEHNKELAKIRTELKRVSKGVKFGYKYTATVYREIAMQNSDFGGMENVGNTTITANRIMPHKDMTDGSFEYMLRVKVHEFYHNINGSEVTGRTPFEIWLNEAVTVHIELWFHAFLWGEGYSRLESVLGLLSPDGGTYVKDSGVSSMPIEPDGFNDPNELISSITYVKAPEVVRMVETLIGKEKFALGLHNYHTKYAHSNATTTQWFEEMEKVSGIKLKAMSDSWLKRTKYPVVEVTSSYDPQTKNYTLNLVQINAEKKPWLFPFKFALLDEKGKQLYESIYFVKEKEEKIVVSNVHQPKLASLNRESSFFGKVLYKQSKEELLFQLQHDHDPINKFMAFYKIADSEKLRLLENPDAEVSNEFIDLYFSLISNEHITHEFGSSMFVLFESVEDERFKYEYEKLYQVKRKIQKAAAQKHKDALLKLYDKYSLPVKESGYLRKAVIEVKRRQIKNACLKLLSLLETPDVHKMIKKQFETAASATDKIVGLSLYTASVANDRMALIEKYSKVASENLVRWEVFLSVMGSSDAADVIDLIKWAEKLPQFRIEQSNDHRALYSTFTSNLRKSLLTPEGRQFFTEIILKLTPVNEYPVSGMLSRLGLVDKLSVEHRAECAKILADVLKQIDTKKYPSVYNTAKRIFLNLPVARKEYEEKYGKLDALN